MSKRVLAIAASLLLYSSAHGAVVQGDYLGTFSGNDSDTALLAELGLDVTLLTKVETPDTSNAAFEIANLVLNDDGEPNSGQWSYTGPGVVDYLVIKAGPMYAVYLYTDVNTSNMRNMGLWDNTDVDGKGLSHITAYTNNTVIPLPAAFWLMGSSLLGLGLARRRK